MYIKTHTKAYIIIIYRKLSNFNKMNNFDELRAIIKTENSSDIINFLVAKKIFIEHPKCLRCQSQMKLVDTKCNKDGKSYALIYLDALRAAVAHFYHTEFIAFSMIRD